VFYFFQAIDGRCKLFNRIGKMKNTLDIYHVKKKTNKFFLIKWNEME